MSDRFHRAADLASYIVGSPWSLIAVALFLVVANLGLIPLDSANFLISEATLLLLVLLQASTNRGNKALMLKLDELLKVGPPEADEAIGAEDLPQQELDALHDRVKEGVVAIAVNSPFPLSPGEGAELARMMLPSFVQEMRRQGFQVPTAHKETQ